MRVCIIGNSHVGSLKRAWDGFPPDKYHATFDFFAQRAFGMTALEVKDGLLVPGNESLRAAMIFTSGGADSIDPANYDAFLLYGLRTKPFLGLLNTGVSSQVKRAVIHDQTAASFSWPILKMIRTLTNKKIYLGHDPLPAAPSVKIKKRPSAYLAGIQFINEEIYLPLNSELLPQPRSTIVNRWQTDPLFSQGSKRLEEGNPNFDNRLHHGDDRAHMNDEFGGLWLNAYLQVLAKQNPLNFRDRASRRLRAFLQIPPTQGS